VDANKSIMIGLPRRRNALRLLSKIIAIDCQSGDVVDQIKNSTIRFGVTTELDFRAGGNPGDWRSIDISFDVPFGAVKPFLTKGVPQEISVIATAVNPRHIAPVPVIKNVTATGFTLSARNARDADGSAQFSWLAVLGNPDSRHRSVDVRFGALQTKILESPGKVTDWPGVWYSDALLDPQRAQLLTANNVTGPSRADIVWNNPAAVGMITSIIGSASPTPLPEDAFAVGAVNVDTTDGRCGFYWLGIGHALQRAPSADDDLWLDHGSEKGAEDSFKYNAVKWPTPPHRNLAPGGTSGDWRHLDVYFEHPFLTPPIVLLTARDLDHNPHHLHNPLVAIAQNVSTHGFTVALRNTDVNGATAEFNWIAIGCQAGCG